MQYVYRFVFCLHHRVHTEWQRPLSGVHSIMMEKLAQASEGGGGLHAHPLHYSYSYVQSCNVHAPAEWADTLTLSHL